MDAERLRAYLLTLPDAVETMQWGNNLVYWVGDKAIGGKMFALINLDPPQESSSRKPHYLLSFSAGPERYAELLEFEGLAPAPYMARIHWIAAEHWHVFSNTEWESHLQAAHALTLSKLPPRTRAVLALPAPQQKRLIAERRAVLAKPPVLTKPKPPAAARKASPKNAAAAKKRAKKN